MRLSEAGLRELEQQLQQHGFAALRAVQRWLQKRWGVCSTYSGVGYGGRLKWKAKLKTGRVRAVQQGPEAVEAFKKSFRRWGVSGFFVRTRRALACGLGTSGGGGRRGIEILIDLPIRNFISLAYHLLGFDLHPYEAVWKGRGEVVCRSAFCPR